MKYIIVFILLCYNIFSFAQKPHYSKHEKILWEKDTLFAIKDNSSLNIKNIEVSLSPGYEYCVITITNNSDLPIEVNWSMVIFKCDGKSVMNRLRNAVKYDEQQQIQKVPKKGRVWQYFDSMYGEKILDLKNAKKQYGKNKKPAPIVVEVTLPIIYNDEEILVQKNEYGLYYPNYKE